MKLRKQYAEQTQKNSRIGLRFKMGSDYEILIDMILHQLESFSKDKDSETKLKSELLMTELKKLKIDGIVYQEYLLLSEKVAHFYNSYYEPHLNTHYDPSNSHLLKTATQIFSETGFFLIPVADSFNLSDFILSRAAPVYFVGIRDKVEMADYQDMPPLSFLFHDVNHAREMSIADRRIILENEQATLKYLNLMSQLSNQIIEKVNTLPPKNQKMMKYFLFSWLHENNGLSFYELVSSNRAFDEMEPQAAYLVRRGLGFEYDHSGFQKAKLEFQKFLKSFQAEKIKEIEILNNLMKKKGI